MLTLANRVDGYFKKDETRFLEEFLFLDLICTNFWSGDIKSYLTDQTRIWSKTKEPV